MAIRQLSEVMQHLRHIVLRHDMAGLSDGQLLTCFVNKRDEGAIEALVRRHGAMVWDVCRRVLPSHHDAEDAFQATFLVLVRKAASIGRREMVANWLYGVAHQTALKAKSVAIKRCLRERQVTHIPETAVSESSLPPDLQPLLDQELSRLPDKYRSAIILCDLEGRTRKEAAGQLKVPEGTLSTRLMRARTMLAKRLAWHGLAITGVVVGTALSEKALSASVPISVLCSTIKAATFVAAGNAAASGLVSANVAALTEGVMKSMLLKKLKMITALLLLMLSTVLLTSALGAWAQVEKKDDSASQAEKQNALALADPLTPPRQKKDDKKDALKYFTNSLGMKFVWIPAGTFFMGSPPTELHRHDNETQRQVTLTKGFYMGVYPVTQEQWQAVMGKNPSKFLDDKNLPVERVSWDDCQSFIKKLREKDKKSYRLPTEAEWEYACRAGTTTPFHFGETISTDQANYDGEEVYGNGKQGVNRGETTPVGSFPANAWGLHDMHGNVFQWCQDRYQFEYSPQDIVDPQGPNSGNDRVLRGGSYANHPKWCRSAARLNDSANLRSSAGGFRICYSPD